MLIEAMNPVAQGLAIHTPDARRFLPAAALQYRRQRQKSAALIGVLGTGRKLAKLGWGETGSYLHR